MGQRGAHYRAVVLLKHTKAGVGPRIEEGRLDQSDLVTPTPREVTTDQRSQLQELLQNFRTRNRRIRLDVSSEANAPIFKSIVYKLRAEKKPEDPDGWVEREFWITKGQEIAYFSELEGRTLIYCHKRDLENGT